MGSWRELLFLYLILLNILTLTVSQPDLQYYFRISESGNYSTNSTYQRNLETLLSSLPSGTDRYGFYSSSFGEDPDRVNAIVLCRGDVDLNTCRRCIKDSTIKLPQLVPNYKGAIGWYDYCMLRYSNKSIYGIRATRPSYYMWNNENASSVNEFNLALRSLLDGLRSQAVSGGAHRKFATNNTVGPDFQTIYGLMQCTPDLSQIDCNNCLLGATEQISKNPRLRGKRGGRYLTPSCSLRYQTYQFFTEIPADAPPPPDAPADAPPATSGKDDNTTRTIIIIVVSTIGSMIGFIVCVCIFLRKRKQKKNPKQKVEEYAMHGQFSVKSDVFSFGVLVLEILSGQKNNSFRNGENVEDLLSYAWKTWREGTSSNLIDPVLRANSGSMREMIRCIHIGLLCVQENITERPTMASVVLMLSSSSLSLPVPSEPAFFLHSGSTNPKLPLLQEHGHQMAVSDRSTNEVSITELDPR
ncbi:hypothetical protein RHSIM_Rhsim07G0197600 [Rhododendron simsii]|uniref:Gnk2-homologous domain-containing protein n=1 Tax=Rhododendron simsii TaxID=118357 RepID=A0A834GPR3_RHOSS|nr:hypothetical protein RHSIM_Rhsim07G0197600 [Rhododendron simsii]